MSDRTDWSGIAVIVGIGGLIYLLYQVSKGIKKAGQAAGAAVTTAGNAVGSAVYDLLHLFSPDPGAPSTYYTVTFPAGQRYAVPSTLVDSGGKFPWLGAYYQLMVDQSGNKSAQLLSDPSQYTVIWIDNTIKQVPGDQVDFDGNYSIGVTTYKIAMNPVDYNYHATIEAG